MDDSDGIDTPTWGPDDWMAACVIVVWVTIVRAVWGVRRVRAWLARGLMRLARSLAPDTTDLQPAAATSAASTLDHRRNGHGAPGSQHG